MRACALCCGLHCAALPLLREAAVTLCVRCHSNAGCCTAAVPLLYRCRYAETVIHRIFYYNNRLGDGQMSWREFRR